MDDLKTLYFRIENPIDNKVKWNKLLNTYSTSYDYEDFASRVIKKEDSDELYYDNDDKKSFSLMMWSIWKNKVLSISDEELRLRIENKELGYDIYEVITTLKSLESVKNYEALQEVLKTPEINKYYTELFDNYNNKVSIYSDFNIKKDNYFNTVLSVRVDATKLYSILKEYVHECVGYDIPYYIKFNECGQKIIVNFYTTVEYFKNNESILSVLRKENNSYFHDTKDLLAGNLSDFITLRNKDYYNPYQYTKERSLILFKSFESVTYEYVLNHFSILVSYKDGRMTISDYISTFVMERVVSQLIMESIKTREEYFNFTNSEDLVKLKEYIKEKLNKNIKDILKDKLYLKKKDDTITLKLNDSKSIKIDVEIILRAIRSLTLTLLNKDSSLEKAYRIRIKNECQFYKVDYDKFCLDAGFSQKLFYNKDQYEKYQTELDRIHKEIEKVESLEALMSTEINDETKEKISSSMAELRQIFNLEEGN